MKRLHALACACLLVGCHPSSGRTAPKWTLEGSPSDASSDAIDVDASSSRGSVSVATVSVGPPAAAFSADTWLRDHGIAHWDHDAACWTQALNQCECHGSLTLATEPRLDLLACSRTREPHGPVPRITHTVLYAADRGRLRLALDVATRASTGIEHIPSPSASEAQNDEWLFGNDVRLDVSVDGADVVILDIGDGPRRSTPDPRYTCGAVVLRVAQADPSGVRYVADKDVAEIQRTYRSVCASAGRWRWNGASLVRVG
jgi:hypothetical protein